MSIYSNIDLETFKWVKSEVEITLESASTELQRFVDSDDKEILLGLTNLLHQVLGSLQMLEMRSLSVLVLESEMLVEDFSNADSRVRKSSFVVLVDSAVGALKSSFERIEQGLAENPTYVVELINQIRAIRGLDEIEISSLFSPSIEVFPAVDAQKALKTNVYASRARALRSHYQSFLLQWLRDGDDTAVDKIRVVFEKLLKMSTFGSVARLWWVASAYVDYVKHNDLGNKSVHSRIFRKIDDRFRNLEIQGESALVRDPGEELIKIMLFYTGVGEKRTKRMDEISDVFKLEEYFPALKVATDTADFGAIQASLEALKSSDELPLPLIRQLITKYFETEQTDSAQLTEIIEQLGLLNDRLAEADVDVVGDVLEEALNSFHGIRKGLVGRDEDTAFHLASAFMFVENSVNEPAQADQHWLQNGQLKLQALGALNNQQELTPEMDGSHLTGNERQALLDVVGSEVEENLKDIEINLEKFSADPDNKEPLAGIDGKIRQIRGALQVMGEQKVGLLLKMAEEQFVALESGESEASGPLIEALAISVGTMEEYVKSLQAGRENMDYLLDRSITDLELAIGKRVSRDDVEDLLDNASDSLLSWLGNQSDFDLFTKLKSSLRDLTTLSKKTKLLDVEHLVKEQDRLVDVISQEPAFLTENITTHLQNNMASIAEQIITLYGTDETPEELDAEAELVHRKSAIEGDQEDATRFHDDMPLEELDDDIAEAVQGEEAGLSSTEIGKQNAVEEDNIDDAIFEVFVEESIEVLEAANQLIAVCEQDPSDRSAIRDLRRSFHTLKGSARMVGLNQIGEVAWFSESLFNYVLDTEKSLTSSILAFSREAIDEFEKHLGERYKNQHLVDTAEWGAKTERVSLQEQEADEKSNLAEVKQSEPDVESDVSDQAESVSSDADQSDSIQITSPSSEDEADIEFDVKFDLDEPADVDEDIDIDDLGSASFSVIGNPEMREVFIEEASANLARIREQLDKDQGGVAEDDITSISVHTLLGNARTLGLTDVAEAYDRAEQLLFLKHEHSDKISQPESDSLRALVDATDEFVNNPLDQEPYFVRDQDQWQSIVNDLQTALEAQSAAHSLTVDHAAEDVVEDIVEDDLIELELDSEIIEISSDGDNLDLSVEIDSSDIHEFSLELDDVGIIELDETLLEDGLSLDEIQIEEQTDVQSRSDFSDLDALIEIDISEQVSELSKENDLLADPETLVEQGAMVELDGLSDPKSESEASERVAAVFNDLEDVGDLLGESASGDRRPEIVGNSADDLSSLEQSLSAFNNDSNIELTDGIEQSEDASPLEFDGIDLDGLLEPAPSVDDQESLLPDDLTNLMQEDILEHDVEIEFAQSDDTPVFSEEQEELVGEVEPESEVEPEPEVEPEAETSQDDEDDDVSHQLRGIFIEEMRGIHHELDDEVAKLSNLGEMAPAMANVMRHLHTIKGSSLMVEARTLGDLTHHAETFLEQNYIRDEDGLREVRKTLEQYVDVVDAATNAFEKSEEFTAPDHLLERLGVVADAVVVEASLVEDTAVFVEMAPAVPAVEDLADVISDFEISELLSDVVSQMEQINTAWKSARGWAKVQPQMTEQYAALQDLISNASQLEPISPLLNRTQAYIDALAPQKVSEFRQSKALLDQAFDVVIAASNSLTSGATIEPFDGLMDQLQIHDEPTPRLESTEPLASAKTVDASIFVPGSTQLSAAEQQDKERQDQAVRDRVAALRIKTETLDSLTNYVGDASMNRSQMRQDVVSIKSVVDELYRNVQRFGTQLRELEMEADSKITSRSSESVTAERSEEFDPLELDRYTKLQQLSRGLAENLDELGGIQTSLSSFVYKAENSLQKQDRLNRELQDEIMQVRLVSFGGIGPQLRQVVRRTARELKKDVELELIGAEVRLDKSILDGVVPALEHMLRNAVDHGVETPAARRKAKKSKVGKVTVECRQVAREIMISVRDDGAGLDLKKIRDKAIEDKLLTEDQPLNPEDMLMYISQSGFSTASKLTQISGRGVGMDVVQSTLRRMSGSIAYDLENDQGGSNFVIRLPISLAVSSAMFVESGGEQFAIAARTIERIVNVDVDELIGYLKAEKPRMEMGGINYSLIDLADYLGYDSQLPFLSGKLSVILVNAGVQNIAVIVEKLLDTQEIMVKNLGGHLGRIPIYAGATIRGEGNVVLLLDLVGISYYESFVAIPEQNIGVTHAVPTVMVVDDSLTVRKSAERDITGLGINSVLAKDGLDAQIQLRQESPDMILLDIEMPRMDGFELLEWVKSQDDLKNIPVVMISSRATEKYIDKATLLGCSAFLGKPYLLENLVQVFNQYLTLDMPIVLDAE